MSSIDQAQRYEEDPNGPVIIGGKTYSPLGEMPVQHFGLKKGWQEVEFAEETIRLHPSDVGLTLTLKVKGMRRTKARIWLGVMFANLGARIAGADLEVEMAGKERRIKRSDTSPNAIRVVGGYQPVGCPSSPPTNTPNQGSGRRD